MVVILLLNMILTGVVNAEGISVRVYNKERCPDYIKYDGVTAGCTRVEYKDSVGGKYPAYCIDRDMPGIGIQPGEQAEYNVEVQDNFTNTLIWRIITNSYPYVSSQELGVETVCEAFVATKQAIYCILYGNDVSKYTAINAEGERVVALIKKLVNIARNSNTSRPSTVINVIDNSQKWYVDNVDENYISKIYSIGTEAEYGTYNISLNSSKLPEGTRIVNLNNVDKTTFGKGERFKVLIPVNHSIENGEFTINVSASLRTCPVYFGKAPQGLQSYALAANPYEDGSGSLNQTFSKNNSKITIIKKDAKTKQLLEGTEFNILNSNKKIVYSNLITDINGRVTLSGVAPGKYFLQELRATDGYVKLENLVEFDMELNKEITLTVNNNKIQSSQLQVNTEDVTVNVSHKESNVDISDGKQSLTETNDMYEVSVSNKDQNANKQESNYNVNIENTDINSTTQETDVNKFFENTDINTNIQDTDINTAVEDTDINTNVQDTDVNTAVQDSNINTNIQDTSANTAVQDANINTNVQDTNANTDVQDANINTNVQDTNTNTDVKNTNVNTNVQNTGVNVNVQDTNVNTNVQNTGVNTQQNVVKKLPKTGF